MTKKLQLTIPQPCHEDWDAMSPVEKGKFCDSCRKQVIDFSEMNDREIAQFFKKPSTGSICGRFMTSQLDRQIDIPRKRIPWFKYFFSILIPAFFISKAGAQKLMGKPNFVERDTTRVPIDHEFRALGMVLPTTIKPVCNDSIVKAVKVTQVKLNGRVVDEEGNPVPDATIHIVESGKLLQADDQGRFEFIAAGDKMVELVVTSVGFEPLTYMYPFTLSYSARVDVAIQMKKAVKEMGEVVLNTICSYRVGYLVGGVTVVGVKDIAADSVQKVIQPPVESAVKFYPNPIRSGQTLHIELIKIEEGYYSWQLFDINGRAVQQTEIFIDENARLMDLKIPYVSSGTYIAVLVNKKTGKRYSEKIIID